MQNDGSVELGKQIVRAFRGCTWPHQNVPEPRTGDEMLVEVSASLLRFQHEDVYYYLPKILAVYLHLLVSHKRLPSELDAFLSLLNVKGEFDEGRFRSSFGEEALAEMKAETQVLTRAKEQLFEALTNEQVAAICAWVEFVDTHRPHGELSIEEHLPHCLTYWRQRAALHSHG